MKKTYSPKFGRYVYEIFAGDYFATDERNVILSTLLGSCVAVCLRDQKTGVVGINHFMLPSNIRVEEIIFSRDARYGINAMEKMINMMMKLGAKRNSIQAKVFGGGQVLDQNLSNVAQSNIDFAKVYLQMEEIPVVASDVGGKKGRKIFFFSNSFDIYMKRIRYQGGLEKAVSREKKFYNWMQDNIKKDQDSELTLFERGEQE